MTDDLSFRPATAADAETVVALVNGAYRGESSKRGWTTEADLLDGKRTDLREIRALIARDDGSVLLLCEQDGTTIGCVDLACADDRVYLGLLVVRPDLQGRGIGKRFMEEGERFAEARGARTIWMTVITEREELIAFYERRGYRRTGRFTPFPPDALSTPRVEGLRFEVLEKLLDR